MFPKALTAAAAAALIVVASATETEAGKPRALRVSGAVKDAKGKWTPVDVVRFESEGLQASVQYLDAAARRAAIASVVGREIDLFPEPSAAARGYLAFALEIDNGAGSDVVFEPGQSRLITHRRREMEFPLEYAGLHEALARQPRGAPTLEEVERAVYARAVTIRPGGAVKKLLVFEAPRDRRWKGFEVRIGALHLAAGDLDAVFTFRKFEVTP